MAATRRRFVIQLHTTRGGRHYDLMLQAGSALATWRLERLPLGLGRRDSLLAQALGDHRLAYLTYQGPVSGGRGAVRIADAGECRILARSADLWIVQLAGRRVRGVFTLRRLGPATWRLAAGPAGGRGSSTARRRPPRG